MPAKNKIYTRSQQKYDTEEHWKLAAGFVPLAGEVIVYAPDETHKNPRMKIGNGKDNVNELLFVEQPCAPAQNLMSLFDANDLEFEYSTQGTGWLVQIVDNNDVQLVRKYFTQGVPTDWEHYSIPFTTNGTGNYVTVNIRKAAEDAEYVPGDFAFDNFQCALHGQTEGVNLLKNGDFQNGLSGWNVNEKFASQCRVVGGSPSIGHDSAVLSIEVPDSSAKYATILDQTVSALPNTPYEFSMWTYSMADQGIGQARVYFFDQNGTQIHYHTANAGSAFSTSFATGPNVTAIKVAIRGNLQYLADDMVLKIKIPQIKNGDFSQGVTSWETCSTYNSDYVPEEILEEDGNKSVRTRCDQIGPNHTSASFIKQTHIYVQKNTTYSLEFDIKRLSESAVWQKYTTIMERDKFALMYDNALPTEEWPKFGGPWANALHYDYILRCTINKPMGVNFELSHVGVISNILSSMGSEVVVEALDRDGKWRHIAREEFEENVEWYTDVQDKFKLLSCNDCRSDEFEKFRITFTFQGDSTLVDENFYPKKNFIKGIRLYGYPVEMLIKVLPNEPKLDYFGDLHCANDVRASRFIGDIDDGSLTWRDL